MLVILVNEIAHVGRYLGYCWLVGLVGCDMRSVNFAGSWNLPRYLPTYREGGEGRGWIVSGWVPWWKEGWMQGGSVSHYCKAEFSSRKVISIENKANKGKRKRDRFKQVPSYAVQNCAAH